MGFFSNLTRSWQKSSRLQELERLMARPTKASAISCLQQ